MKKNPADYITEIEAMELTGYKRTRLYQFRFAGEVRWVCTKSGRKIKYHKGDLLKVLGF